MKAFWRLVFGLLLVSCGSEDRAAGGGGIEIPNGIEIAVRTGDGTPVVGARVAMVAGEDWVARLARGESLVLDSATTDGQGIVKLPTRAEFFWAEIQAEGGNARVSSRDGAVQSATLQPGSTLSGTLKGPFAPGDRVWLAGTGKSAVADSSGRFSFPGVVPGRYALVLDDGTADGRRLVGDARVGWGAVERLSLHSGSDGLLLDDFDDGDIAWSLRDVFSDAWWWLDADAPRDSLRSIFGVATPTEALLGVGGQRWFGVDVTGGASNPSWANFGLVLGLTSGRLPSLDGFEGVVVRVRGKGSQWTVRLATDSSGAFGTWIAPLQPDTAWTEIRIPVAQFRDLGGTSSPLPRKARLVNLVFQTEADGSLEIDDLRLAGVALEDWILP